MQFNGNCREGISIMWHLKQILATLELPPRATGGGHKITTVGQHVWQLIFCNYDNTASFHLTLLNGEWHDV